MGDGARVGDAGLIGGDSLRSPDGVGNRNDLLRLTRKVRSGSEAVAIVGLSLHSLAIDDLIRHADLEDSGRKNLAEREDGAFGEWHRIRRCRSMKSKDPELFQH